MATLVAADHVLCSLDFMCPAYAVELLKAGGQPVVEDVGKGNEACAACIREYKDALAAVVIRRWMRGDGAMEWSRRVADYIHCK